jgi:hypothetical protein
MRDSCCQANCSRFTVAQASFNQLNIVLFASDAFERDALWDYTGLSRVYPGAL